MKLSLGLTPRDYLVAGGAAFVGLLDSYPNASAAYSLRKLRSAYAGNCIRVRRSSDNTEQNIGFVNNALDTTTLLTFCGVGNGFVTTWYDQSSNGNNATQTTAANQPQIVSNGNVITITGIGQANPTLLFDGVNDSFSFTNVNITTFTSFYPQAKPLTGRSAWFTQNVGTGGPYTPIMFGDGNIYIGNSSKTTWGTYSNSNTQFLLLSGYVDSSNNGFIKSNNSGLSLPGTFVDGGQTYFNSINNRGNLYYSYCYTPEMILYNFNNSANESAINDNINNYFKIY